MNPPADSPSTEVARVSDVPVLPPLERPTARRLAERLRRQVRELDVAYTPHDHRAGERLEWRIDPQPILLAAETWEQIAAAVRQRTRVLNCLLADLYTRQEALHQKLVPPDLVLGDPYFRRPCVGLEPHRANPATLVRCDLMRTVGGEWRFVDTFANTPIGLSYAVQTRRLLMQERGDLYADLPEFRRVINFPVRLLDHLKRLSPRVTENPNIVVLTPGPQDTAYFEHSFLARKMGLPLAQGGDLLVLDDGVYFKTVAGLVQVDVIYRRLNDSFIDPVVFPTNRLSGVPGLIASIRAGRVAVANAIGVGVADNRGLEAYLPKLLRYYLNERAVLPGVTTYYCGDIDQFAAVLDDTEGALALMPGQPGDTSLPSYFPGASTAARRRALAAIRHAPHAYVARHMPTPDHAASSLGDRTHRATHISCFALCEGAEVEVMPGAMVRLMPGQSRSAAPVWQVGETADLVVLAPREGAPPEPDVAPPERVRPLLLGSRAADNLFWAGRYSERAEATARILSVMEDVGLEEISRRERRAWYPVWRGMLDAVGQTIFTVGAGANWFTPELAWRMTLQADNPSSLVASVLALRENLLLSRDFFSPEAWAVVSRLHEEVEQHVARGTRSGARRRELATAAVNAVLERLAAFFGTLDRTMLHDIGWHFFQAGVQLERATMTATALRPAIAEAEAAARENRREEADLSALVRLLSSQDAYRRTYQARVEPLFVTELFLVNRHAPKSVHTCLLAVHESFAAISSLTGAEDDPPLRDLRAILARFAALDLGRHFAQRTDSPRFEELAENKRPDDEADAASAPPAETLAEWIDDLQARLENLLSAMHDFYFSHQARLETVRTPSAPPTSAVSARS